MTDRRDGGIYSENMKSGGCTFIVQGTHKADRIPKAQFLTNVYHISLFYKGGAKDQGTAFG